MMEANYRAEADYLPWLDLLGLNVMAGATVLGVPVEQMLTTENVAGSEVESNNWELWHEMQLGEKWQI